MLLGRLKNHLSDHNWSALIVDVVVVIVSILVAFQIDRWAEQRRDQHLETEYLQRLRQDLLMEIERMDSALRYAGDRIKAVELLAQAAEDPSASGGFG